MMNMNMKKIFIQTLERGMVKYVKAPTGYHPNPLNYETEEVRDYVASRV